MVKYKRSYVKRPEDIWTLYIPQLNGEINSSLLYNQSDIDNTLIPWKEFRDSFPGFISSEAVLNVENNNVTTVTLLDNLARAIEFHSTFYSSNSNIPQILAMRNLVTAIAQAYPTVYTVESLVCDADGNVLHTF